MPHAHGLAQTSTAVGLTLAVAGICAAAASWQIQRFSDRLGYRRVLIIATALAGLFYAPAFFVDSLWQLVLVRAAIGFCLGAAMPTSSAIVGLVTPENRRASAYSLTASASSFGLAAGPLVGGALGAVFGLRVVFLLTAVVLLLVAGAVAAIVPEPTREATG